MNGAAMGFLLPEEDEGLHPDYEALKDLIGPLEDLNRDLKIELAKYKRAYDTVVQLHRSLNSALVVRSLLDAVASLFLIGSAAVVRFEKDNKFRVLGSHNISKGTVERMLDQMQAMIEEARLTRRPVIVADALKDKTLNLISKDFPSIALIPMILGHEAIGGILINNWVEGAFSGAILDILNLIASAAAVALKNAETYESLKGLAFIDPDTEVYNRRYFEDYLRHLIDQETVYPMQASVVLVGFRNLPDLGNTTGKLHTTALLKRIAITLSQRLEKPHILCRYNVSTLALILPGVDESMLSIVRSDVEGIVDESVQEGWGARPDVKVLGFVIPGALESPKEVTRLADRHLSLQERSEPFPCVKKVPEA